jgi:acyl-CoA thioesterase I
MNRRSPFGLAGVPNDTFGAQVAAGTGVLRLGWRVLGVGLLSFCAACQQDARQNDPAGTQPPAGGSSARTEGEPLLLFLGDSLIAGLGLPEEQSVPRRIQAEIDNAGKRMRVVNAGRSGDTTAGGLGRVDWYLRDGANLDIVVLGLGSNDAMRGLPVESIESNLRAIIARIRERKPNARILLWELQTFPNLGPEYGASFAQVFRRVAQTQGVALIDFPLAQIAGKPEFNQADGIHPNAAGAQVVANKLWGVLQPLLEP